LYLKASLEKFRIKFMAKFLYKIFLFEPPRRVENFVINYCRKFLNFSQASDFLVLFLEKEPRAERKYLNIYSNTTLTNSRLPFCNRTPSFVISIISPRKVITFPFTLIPP